MHNLDDSTTFHIRWKRLPETHTRNFVIEIEDVQATCAIDLDAGDIGDLVKKPVVTRTATRPLDKRPDSFPTIPTAQELSSWM